MRKTLEDERACERLKEYGKKHYNLTLDIPTMKIRLDTLLQMLSRVPFPEITFSQNVTPEMIEKLSYERVRELVRQNPDLFLRVETDDQNQPHWYILNPDGTKRYV